MTLQEKQLDTAMQVHPESPVKSGKMQGTFKKAVITIKVSNAIGNDVKNKRLVLREARESAYDATRISIRRLEMAQHQGLVLPTEDGTVVEDSDRAEQAEIIRGMAIPMADKSKLRDYVFADMSSQHHEGCTASCADTKAGLHRGWVNMKSKLGELKEALTLWTKSLKTIEGQFGSGVLMYFRFLRWLFMVNFFIFVLVFVFTVIPQAILPDDMTSSTSKATTPQYNEGDEGETNCSALYVVKKPVHAYSTQPVIDFLQGTGWMEKTIAFYGAYKDNRVLVSTTSYNLPLAFILTALSCFLLSLVLVIRQTANGIRDKLVGTESNQKPYLRLTFTIWDYGLTDPANSKQRCTNIWRELQCNLSEDRMAEERLNRSRLKSVFLWSKRIFINLLVFAILAGACLAIYLVITKSIKIKREVDFENKTPMEQLFISFMTSFTITALNSIVPIVFKKLVTWEGYSFAIEVNFTLGRTVFLKLASLIVLVYTIYVDINCSPKDDCNVGIGKPDGKCSELRCWETLVGQEFYKLVLVDVFAVVAIVLLVESPRRIIVTRKWCCSFVGLQEFDIPKNILDLIYSQVLVWFGTFFSPMIPLMTVLKLVFVFYLKMVSLLYNFTPSTKPYRASDSHFFVQIVLLGAYVVCIMPIIFVIWSMSPSTGCGPFRSHDYMYQIMSATINDWPRGVKAVAEFISSTAFAIPAFIALLVVIYFLRRMMHTYKKMIEILREQLVMENNDTKYFKELLMEKDSPRPVSSRKRPVFLGRDGGAGDGLNGYDGNRLTASEA
ncbi:Transmembrane channel-like protein 7 [Lamellibrachia satsuma]|nr:Transmembrane channel-like protein 7 [Lamellibrachia satsuma]